MEKKLLMAPTSAVPSPDEYVEIASGADIDIDGLVAFLHALKGDRRRLAARARDPAVTLSAGERNLLAQIAETYTPPPRPKTGNPPAPVSKKLAVASFYIKALFWEGQPPKRALHFAAKRSQLGEGSVKKYLTYARRYKQGRWWRRVCELARKHKCWPELVESIPE
jgi:hypothetical protein